ncbi:hypothetical protein HK100_004789 [Physocladia obscura]|uniref:Uncharacterized protein n=1 Tax=Physocladia obscura TaxID=109957 RepID=A0AAD5T752_9FUNG|nr:hypothetical protein HK100_004789 [Physocladia obscura]
MKLLLFALGSIAACASALPDITDVNGATTSLDSKPAAAILKDFTDKPSPPNSPSFSKSHAAGPNVWALKRNRNPLIYSRPGLGKAPYGGYYNDYYGYSDYDSYDDDYDSYGYDRKKRDAPYGDDYGYGYNDYNNYYGDDNSYGYGYGRK